MCVAQQSPSRFSLEARDASLDRPSSNSAIEILIKSDSVWVAGGKGLNLTTDGGATWRFFGDAAPFDKEDIASLDAVGPVMWASLAGSEKIDNTTTLPKGLGLASSTDNGATWTRMPQPMEKSGDSTFILTYGANRLKALAITTEFNNITYDLSVSPGAVWTASFAGGLRRSTDNGKTFLPVVLPPDNLDSIRVTDTLSFDLSPVDRPDFWNLAGTQKGMRGNLNHRVFSVLAITDSLVWVGTAGGVNVTTDAGNSWRKCTFTNQFDPISGNFVVALGRNVIGGVEHIWAATINALEPLEYRAVSVTTDMGRSWTKSLRGEFTHNFGFKGPVAYAATNSGILRSDDAGRTWSQHSVFYDKVSRNRSTDPACYAAASQGDIVWVANADGLMKTEDSRQKFFGDEWTIFRAAQPADTPESAYAYPNPFSPSEEVCRVHFRMGAGGTVSIEIYDFGMLPVHTVLRNAQRLPGKEYDEIWDGKNNDGTQVANGIYYLRVTIGDGEPAWAKVIVLQ